MLSNTRGQSLKYRIELPRKATLMSSVDVAADMIIIHFVVVVVVFPLFDLHRRRRPSYDSCEKM